MSPKEKFIQWVRQNDPVLYEIGVRRYVKHSRLSGIGDFFDSFVGTITDIAPKYLDYKKQKELLDLQIKQVKQGLIPLPAEYTAPASTMTDDEIRAAIQAATADQTGQTPPWLWPVVALGGLFVLAPMLQRRR